MSSQQKITIPQQPADASIVNLTEEFDKLSPTTQESLRVLLCSISKGKAQIDYDKDGKQFIDYKEKKSKLFWDASNANLPAHPKKAEDVQVKVDACLELVDFLKTEKPPSGILLDKTKISLSPGKDYREGHEFINTMKVLGRGNSAGDIIVCKDKKTGSEHARKTMMISVFRKEEIRCWVDMEESGFVPCLYYFSIVKNKISIHMEILKNAKTLRSIIDEHMGSFYKEKINHSLVKPFSLFVLDGALDAVSELHRKGWLHKDIHAEQFMVQKKDHNALQLKILDFGLARRIEDDMGIDYRGLRTDLANVVRLFTGLYTGMEFNNEYDIRHSWEAECHNFADNTQMSLEDKKELFCLVDAALGIVTPSDVEEYRQLVKQKLTKAMGDTESSSDIMKRVVALLFQEDFQAISHDAKEDVADSVIRSNGSGAATGMNVIDGAANRKTAPGSDRAMCVEKHVFIDSIAGTGGYAAGGYSATNAPVDESDFYDLAKGSGITDGMLEMLRATMSICPK